MVLRKILNVFGIASIILIILAVGLTYYHNWEVEQDLKKANTEWLARDVFDYLNYYRRSTGGPSFKWDKQLANIAVEHSRTPLAITAIKDVAFSQIK